MDFSEKPAQPFRRHPWEVARFRFFRAVLRDTGAEPATGHRARRARRLRREQWWARRHGARRRPGDVVAAVPRSRNEPADVARSAVLVDVSAERVAEDLVVAGIEDLARAGVVRGRVGVHGPA